ncbi:electron transfer flavoprotein-quinone oxidoreductase [Thioploca ingrica]|uniref:Protein FixC n=1 Tax=Thioploca ingrica TaxID=40754 RepID=A0A090AQV8_9GAMM|nr:electron transfer flavoprotein-quinone oxidoreductase [Thioploca ingrica]
MAEKFDVIVIGAGMAGNAAAYTLAKAGFSVLQLERGEYPGSKNVQGAILYADALEKIIPDFRDDAPLERHLIEQRVWVLDDESYLGGHYRSEEFNRQPYNRYTIIRARFDKWFSKKVQQAGALVICETTVNQLLLDNNWVVGVHTDRKGGEIFADAVILADGVNSLLAKKAGFHPEIRPSDVALAVKEIHFFPQEVIESRFNIGKNEGVAIEMAGKISAGMMGTGFLYTNRDSITLGIGCMLSDFKQQSVTPYQLLERMKAHPAIKPLIAGGEMKEYAAHLIPEGGYNAVPPVYGNGWLLAGDAAMLVNGLHREGSNLATASGQLAAQTLIELKAAGKPWNARNLVLYRKKLDASFIMKDLKKYRRLPGIFEQNKHFFTLYPELLNHTAHTLIKVDGLDKKSKEQAIRREFVTKRSLLGLLGDAFKMWRAFE